MREINENLLLSIKYIHTYMHLKRYPPVSTYLPEHKGKKSDRTHYTNIQKTRSVD